MYTKKEAGQFRILHAERWEKESCHHHLHIPRKRRHTPASEMYTLVVLLGQWQMWRYTKAKNSPVEAIPLLFHDIKAELPQCDQWSIPKITSNIIDSSELFLKFLYTGSTLTERKEALLSPFTGNTGYWQGKCKQSQRSFTWTTDVFLHHVNTSGCFFY